MEQGTKPSSSLEKLAKVNMLNTFSSVGKVKKVKKFLLEMDNYYDVKSWKCMTKFQNAPIRR
jgi:hypothetical protein